MMLRYQSLYWMMLNFIADVRKGGDLLKSFEQSNLVSNMSSHANYLHELFL